MKAEFVRDAGVSEAYKQLNPCRLGLSAVMPAELYFGRASCYNADPNTCKSTR